MSDAPHSESRHWSDPVAHLRRALAQDHFTLYCQPIAALSGVVVYPMAEVLVRLREEEAALLPPGEFLPILEHYGMMPELDRWVVGEALRRLASGPEIPRFTLNISPQTIADPRFPEFVAERLYASGVPADCLVFEIEEADAAAAPSSVRRLCATLGSLGAGVLIDGFGRSGDFGALRLPCVQYAKVHGALTRNLATDEPSVEKLQSILRFTSAHGIAVIAECVEDGEVLARLKALHVRYAQGFGICRPQSIDRISELPVMRFSENRPERALVPVQGLLDLRGSSGKGAQWTR
jgi:EAL domain-containing protein (putative c-di-GMP-specific phosphodiesterase class I)